MERDRILVAEIGAAHGLRGEVRLWSFTADPMAVKDYGALEAADGRMFHVEALRPSKNFFVARLRGVSDRDAAEALCKLKLYIPRARLPATQNGEFYHADLIGLAVITTGGTSCGIVVAVQNFGAGDLIEIKPERGATVMLPFTDAVVPQVDIAAGRLVIDPPAGVFDPAQERETSSASGGDQE